MDNTQLPDDDKVTSAGTLKTGHLLIIALVIVVAVVAIYYARERWRGTPQVRGPDAVIKVPEGSRAVTLFFADREDETLVTETRLVAIGKEYGAQIEQVISALLDGPQEERGVSTITDGTRLLNAFYDSEGAILYLDFTSELVAGHPGGSSAEYFTVAAIMRTVSENFPDVRAVQFLIEGLQVGTIAGHLDAYDPFLVRDWR